MEQLQYGKYSDIDSAKAASVVQLDNAKKQLVEISDCLSENKIKVSPKTFAQQSIKAPLRYGLSAH
ncbi:MAG: hypothetical protein PHS93_09930 [Candidatus Omnitrophica bacterium]|nr:hypothetical protein [Candidatus Omnitrophota bacterium]MDD5353468.1 hypothetical protein [Candidatus Omnitrophota bacterium]